MTDKLTQLQVTAWISRALAQAHDTGRGSDLAVGGATGLYLRMSPTGTASWVLRTTINKRRVERGLGGYPSVPLGKARQKATEDRNAARQGIDPKVVREAALQAAVVAAAAAANERTFQQAAEAYIATKESSWRNAKHGQQWCNTLAQYAYPMLGHRLVSTIDHADIVAVLDQIWLIKQETASRLRGRIEKVLDFAQARSWRDDSLRNPAALTAKLKSALPTPAKRPGVAGRRGHHAAMPWADVPAFMARMADRPGMAARALEWLVLTAARSGEVRGLVWSEVVGDVWIVPAERMKAGREHRVPLSVQALAILDAVRPANGTAPDALVFPSPRSGSMLSDMAFTKLTGEVTAHGFRSSFRDWAADHGYDRQLAEAVLAHVLGSDVETAYLRSTMVRRRAPLMQAWADYVIPRPGEA